MIYRFQAGFPTRILHTFFFHPAYLRGIRNRKNQTNGGRWQQRRRRTGPFPDPATPVPVPSPIYATLHKKYTDQ